MSRRRIAAASAPPASWLPATASGGGSAHELRPRCGESGVDDRAVREELASVVEDDDAVAQQRPALLGARADYPGCRPVTP